MQDQSHQFVRAQELGAKVLRLYEKRTRTAGEGLMERMREAGERSREALQASAVNPLAWWQAWSDYAVDVTQRSVLFWDTLRQRGNNYLAHEQAGKPPLLHFEYEVAFDGRSLDRPVNYLLLRIIAPEGVVVDAKRRPYIIIDPRAGHGPGIGGFKDDSQMGVALRAGHPVYFVSFLPEPEPGQTLVDVCEAEARFVRRVRELHPDSPKPVIVGNCQGGWAAMMVAAAHPDDTGPIVIDGAPMSYWGGAWQEGEGDNPMRYAGGLMGGTWLASLTADLGHGTFDGAWLVQNFENLNPANTIVDKYYNLFANVDTEAPRFLEFERWWGGFYLLNKEEIEWIVQNLFVGNKLWSGGERAGNGQMFDLREIKSPIVLFASMGDNITPPQQAFNWVADIYGSTDEIKARGQVIVGLLHQDIGHLGIFVSGKVAKKEHTQIVSVMKSIESLVPGLYGMRIHEVKAKDGAVEYEVDFAEQRLEDIAKRLNRFEREDEKPFEAVKEVAELHSARVRAFCAAAGQGDVERVRGHDAAQIPPTAPSALGTFGPESLVAVARPHGRNGEGEPARLGRGAVPARAGARGLGRAERLPGLLPRDARRDERGRLLSNLRQLVLAVPGRRARGASADERRTPRTARGKGGSGRHRTRRLLRGPGPHRRTAGQGRPAAAPGDAARKARVNGRLS